MIIQIIGLIIIDLLSLYRLPTMIAGLALVYVREAQPTPPEIIQILETHILPWLILYMATNGRSHRHCHRKLQMLIIMALITPTYAATITPESQHKAACMIANLWFRYSKQDLPETNQAPIQEDTQFDGDEHLPSHKSMIITISNSRGGLDNYDKLEAMKEIGEKHNSDVHIISETGKNNRAQDLVLKPSHLQAD